PSRPPSSRRNGGKDATTGKGSQVWILKEGVPEAVAVKSGATDGTLTEILDGTLEPGTQVLVDLERTGAKP
nr:efflux RND transporter periplasmic adaptor subunit [Chromatiaceae bacterium]